MVISRQQINLGGRVAGTGKCLDSDAVLLSIIEPGVSHATRYQEDRRIDNYLELNQSLRIHKLAA